MPSSDSSGSETLARWRAEDEALRARLKPPFAPLPREAVGSRSGLEMLREMIEGRLPSPPIFGTIGYVLAQVEPGRAEFLGRPSAAFLNPLGTLHGGWYATLVDSALGCAVHSTLPAGRAYTTLEIKLNLVRAIGPEVELVRARGRVVHGGRQVATAEADLIGPDGRLYAHGSTTCLIFDQRTAP